MRLLMLAASSACVGCVSLHPSALSGPPQRPRALDALPPDLRGEGSEVVSAPVAAPRASSRHPGLLSRVVPCLGGDTSPSVSPVPLLVRATAASRAGYPAAPRVTFGPPPVVFLDPWYCRYYSRGFFLHPLWPTFPFRYCPSHGVTFVELQEHFRLSHWLYGLRPDLSSEVCIPNLCVLGCSSVFPFQVLYGWTFPLPPTRAQRDQVTLAVELVGGPDASPADADLRCLLSVLPLLFRDVLFPGMRSPSTCCCC